MSTSRRSQLLMVFGGVAVVLLLGGVFTLGSLNLPFEPGDSVVLYALSTFLAAALIVFAFILGRNLVRLGAERFAHKPGSRFKTKMVFGAIAVSFLPVVVLFFVSYALLNRTLVLWFPRPLELATQYSRELTDEMSQADSVRMAEIAKEVAASAVEDSARDTIHSFEQSFERGADLAWELNESGQPVAVGVNSNFRLHHAGSTAAANSPAELPTLVRLMPGGAEVWKYADSYFLAGRAQLGNHYLLAARNVPNDFLERIQRIETETQAYGVQRQHLRTYKTQLLVTLFLFTILLMFTATWFALFLSKQVTVPIQALAEATQEIIAGNLETRVNVQAQDELETLVSSFNRMTGQLSDNRRQIDVFTQNLQQAVQELERRRTLMETILENIPTAVISLDETESIRRVNPAAVRMFGENSRQALNFAQLLGEETGRAVHTLMRRSLRLGTSTQELEFAAGGRLLHAAVTVSSLGPRRSNRGYVIVVDDLTDLLHAQKAAAWQEVAQRIAHEIKNPLTPIQLSSQRLSRYLERNRANTAKNDPPDLVRLVGECSSLIEREVSTLETLVSEFSQFARFPTAKLAPVFTNEIVTDALAVFGGRLEGIKVRTDLAPGLPSIRADGELLRRVIVNLIDNAAESMEGSSVKELLLLTKFNSDRETVEIIIADSGHGISPEDKDRLFLPHFSTKDRGTGLGLAIASRIMAEHYGSIRVEDNFPIGARFILQLPMAEVASAPRLTQSLVTAEATLMANSILIVDDEQGIREVLASILKDEGYEPTAVSSGEECLALLDQRPADLVLLDVWLDGIDGLETLDRMRKSGMDPMVVMISGHASIETAVRATKLGAFDFIVKPLSLEKVILVVKNALEVQRLGQENRRLREELVGRAQLHGDTVPMRALRQQIGLTAPTNGRVLIYGESGTGKELVARALHAASLRSDRAFVEVNCAAIPEELIESELFGHSKGSFTGASENKVGKFEKADGGTLFLDEIGDMSLRTQSKVLRVLEEQRLEPVGSNQTISVDVRVIAATNKRLEDEILYGRFREDLFYRLNVIPVNLPPLRERIEDVPVLARHFMSEFAAAYGRKPKELSDAAIGVMLRYHWPGNVRELRNLIERLMIVVPQDRIEPLHLPAELFRASSRMAQQPNATLHEARDAYEREFILRKLEENQWHMTRTAEALGLERSHLYRRMRSLGITAEG